MREEISRLERELSGLTGREQSLLDRLAALDAERRLRRAELDEVSLRLEDVTAAIDRHDSTINGLETAQVTRRDYLAFRLRQIYKAGSAQELQRFLGGESVERYWEGIRYAAYLTERDARVLTDLRGDRERVDEEREALARTQRELSALHDEVETAQTALEDARRRQARSLERVRDDQDVRRTALLELKTAAEELSRVVDTMAGGEDGPLDMRKFQGLLDWPADGGVRAGFGSVIHPQFKTEVPHPGWDIGAEYGSDMRSVFDGEVVYADWLRGYGLTAIVDHSHGLLSVYAHASALFVQEGDGVVRGEVLGKVGDTGSLRGTLLYFELRVDGRPVDPSGWLRTR